MLAKYFLCPPLLVALIGILSLQGCGDSTSPPNDDGICGDGHVDSGEACDDGNTRAGDGCSDSCQREQKAGCGDGQVDPGEACDDGNAVDGDGCDSTCTNTGCGNGIVTMGEPCDDGNTINGDGCDRDCSKTACGNGIVTMGEGCDDGNGKPGDGCEIDCTKTKPVEIACQDLVPLPQGTCEVTAGTSGKLLVGAVLTPGTIYRGGQVLVNDQGIIVNVGCDCAKAPDVNACNALVATATKITCPTGVISPALINTHDHITFTQNNPYTDTGERYEHRHDWRIGKDGHTKLVTPGNATNDAISWGELRFLLGGATSIVGSGSASGLLRNLDRAPDEEGLDQIPVDFETFPLGDTNGTQLVSGCDYPRIITQQSIASDDAFLPHVAEGINVFAENEFACMQSSMAGGQDLLQPQSAFIHSIGLTATDYTAMSQDGTALIWSPRSNVTLYGDTAIVTEAAHLGVLIALGTDWIATGSMNMLRELRCADELNTKYYGGMFTDEQLWRMATVNAATATGTDDVIGILAPGKVADISIFEGKAHPAFRAIIDADPQDVTLVMRGGKVLYGDAALVTATAGGAACDALDVCGAAKQLCLKAEIGKDLAGLTTSVGGIYPTFFCNGPPMNEPSCTPARPASVMSSSIYDGQLSATDADGDGIEDAVDNCPTVFNPIRPMDNGVQVDFDKDRLGDACDVCPLDARTTGCSVPDPSDADGDGIPNALDNCSNKANPDQADADKDQKGDVCDGCPQQANPGKLACIVTIYAIKNKTVPAGTKVALENALVTGQITKANGGFFLQTKLGDPGYMGSDYSGIFVFDPANTVKVGDRVTLQTATVSSFFGQIQLTGPTTVVNASAGEAPPDPVLVTAEEITTSGARAAALESVIVTVKNPKVTNIAPTPGTADMPPTNEFVITDANGSIRVNDFLFLLTPFPAVDDTFTSISGILDFRNDNSKIEPRSAADFTGAKVKLVGFGPALSFVEAGKTSVLTGPTPLTVTLSGPAPSDTFVSITSGDPASLAIPGGGVSIPTGNSSGQVLVDSLLPAAKVTLTATLGTASLTADVRVVGAAEQPQLASLTPTTATIPPGGTATFTVTLDIPAPTAGTTLDVTLAPPTAGVVPPTVTVLAGQVSATFDYVDGSLVSGATVTVTLGAQNLSSPINLVMLTPGFVINEVDYDQVGADNAEFIEIYNGSGASVNLSDFALVLLNGSNNTTYLSMNLVHPAGVLADKQYLVVGSAAVTATVPGTALTLTLTGAIQNGAPDGIALINTKTKTLVDALSYEGSMTMANATGLGVVNLVEGTPLPTATADSDSVPGSLCRIPDGTDTNNAATDWAHRTTPTPGVANTP
jgi:large repetitive protein